MRDSAFQPTTVLCSTRSVMPLDKQKRATPAKPLTPALSTAFRSSKSPLTPKLAATKNPSPASPPRRLARSETAAPSATPRQDIQSPVTPRLNGNITPRSGARLSRTAVASPSTPGSVGAGKSSKTRPLSAVEPLGAGRSELASSGFRLANIDRGQTSSIISSDKIAHDTRPGVIQAQIIPTSPQHATSESPVSTLFHASSGRSTSPTDLSHVKQAIEEAGIVCPGNAGRSTTTPGFSPVAPNQGPKLREAGKFFRANDRAPDVLSQAKSPKSGHSESTSAVISPAQFPFPSTDGPRRLPAEPIWPPKSASSQSEPGSFSSWVENRRRSTTSSSTPSPQISTGPTQSPRCTTVSGHTPVAKQTTHKRIASTSSAPLTPPNRNETRLQPISPQYPRSAQPLPFPQPPQDHPGLRSSRVSSKLDPLAQKKESTQPPDSPPVSPIKTQIPQTPYIHKPDESAASARRERKVLDLEISNSSLLAINRTLEREMRKQSTELRRFRRLSRTGRLSTMSNRIRPASGDSFLGGIDYDDSAHATLSDCDEEISTSEADDDSEDLSFDDRSSSITSSTSPTQGDSRRCTRDEKRLRHDLSKHQQLLIDSQKMSLSIKRCLNWTEELITEGNKALAYQVKVSDVELGGKVLVGDQEHESAGDDHGGNDAEYSPHPES